MGEHCWNCIRFAPQCLCNTCAKDIPIETEKVGILPCCEKHGFYDCHVTECPDYEKEKKEGTDV